MSKERIVKNRAYLITCEDEIESKHRHDFVTCKCGDMYVDGGTSSLRRGATDLNTIIDTSIIIYEAEK